MSTYRERRAERADRLREWADKRNARASAQLNSQPELRRDWAFITQPGRIPERDRMNKADARAFESMNKAESMSSRADEIDRQLDRSIYSDDHDATERLREKLERLEAERQRWTDYNAAVRKAKKVTPEALALLDPDQRHNVAEIARVVAWQLGKYGQAPAYIGSNLSGNIKRTRDRLAQLEREKVSAADPDARPAGRYMISRYAGECSACGAAFDAGTPIVYARSTRSARHYPNCNGEAPTAAPAWAHLNGGATCAATRPLFREGLEPCGCTEPSSQSTTGSGFCDFCRHIVRQGSAA